MKKLITLALIFLMSVSLVSCNYKMIDTNWHFRYAMIMLPDGRIVEGEIESWTDYEDGEQLQIKFKDGNTYLVSSFNTVLMTDIPEEVYDDYS